MLALYMLFGDLQLSDAVSQYNPSSVSLRRGWAELVATLQCGVFIGMGQNMKREIQSRIMIVVEKVKEEKYFCHVLEVKGRHVVNKALDSISYKR